MGQIKTIIRKGTKVEVSYFNMYVKFIHFSLVIVSHLTNMESQSLHFLW